MPKYKTNYSKIMFYKNLSTLWSLGYFRASGTVASLATLPIVIFLKYFNNEIFYLSSVVLITFFSFYVLHKALHYFNDKDPKNVVIDELCGQLLAFLFVDINVFSLFFLFFMFRFFDIIKPFGIKRIENIQGAYGVLSDDIVAGFYANILYWITLCILYFLS